MKKITATLALLWTSSAIACGCNKPRTPDQVHSFAHIFRGRVVEVATSLDRELRFGKKQNVNFAVLEAVKGPSVSTVKVEFGGSTSCDLQEPDFQVGQEYMISDHHIYLVSQQPKIIRPGTPLHPSGRFSANYCSLRELVPAPPNT